MSNRLSRRRSHRFLNFVAAPLEPSLAAFEALEPRLHFAVGDLDATFGTGGQAIFDLSGMDYAGDLLVQPDGRSIVIDSLGEVLRLLPDGSRESTFGGDGVVTASGGSAEHVALQSDGKLVIGVRDEDGQNLTLLRINADGTRDTAWGAGGIATIPIEAELWAFLGALSFQPDGKIVAVATATPRATSSENSLLVFRLNPDGTPDSSFGAGGRVDLDLSPGIDALAYVASVVVGADGRILIGGTTYPRFPATGDLKQLVVLRLNRDGSRDVSFGDQGQIAVAPGGKEFETFFGDLAVREDGSVLMVGVGPTSNLIAASFTADGQPDALFGVNGISVTELPYKRHVALRLRSDGSFVVAASENGFYTALFSPAGKRMEVYTSQSAAWQPAEVAFGSEGSILVAWGSPFSNGSWDNHILVERRFGFPEPLAPRQAISPSSDELQSQPTVESSSTWWDEEDEDELSALLNESAELLS